MERGRPSSAHRTGEEKGGGEKGGGTKSLSRAQGQLLWVRNFFEDVIQKKDPVPRRTRAPTWHLAYNPRRFLVADLPSPSPLPHTDSGSNTGSSSKVPGNQRNRVKINCFQLVLFTDIKKKSMYIYTHTHTIMYLFIYRYELQKGRTVSL